MARSDRVVARAFLWLFVVVAASMFLFPRTATALWDPTWRPGLAIHPLGTAIAVDLGNTNSCVAGYVRGESETMFQACIPSWVAVSDHGTLLVGEEAKNYAAINPEAAITGFKRLLGKRCGGGVPRLDFQEEAMPSLRRLKVEFNAYKREPHHNTIIGIENMLNLEDVTARIGAATSAEESDKMAAESVIKNAVSQHSRPPRVNIQRVNWVD